MSIRHLPDEVIQHLKSSVAITSLNDAVISLAKNSLDASATKINISVDYSRGNCSVEDDGHGIEPHEFSERGALGKPHCTSKFPPSGELHGRHGCFLSSLATLSLLSVTSKHHAHEDANTITIRNSVVLSRNVPSLGEQRLHHSRHGTRVSVRDLFGSMAVRVKQRPTGNDRMVIERDFGNLMHAVVGLILAWPTSVSVSLRDSQGRSEVCLRPPRSHGPADLKISTKVARILVQSGLTDDISYGTWVSVGASRGDITVSGCMSLNAVATRRIQFISMGARPLTNQHGTNVLYTEINQIFASSEFASVEDSDRLRNGEVHATRDVKSKKRLERWPMFYLRIDRSSDGEAAMNSAEDVLDQPRILSVMLELVKNLSVEFLRKHHFRPRTAIGKAASSQDETPSAPRRSATPRPRPESPFDSWQRIKVGRRADASKKVAHGGDNTKAPALPEPSPSSEPLVSKSGKLLRRPFGSVKWPLPAQSAPVTSVAESTEPAASSVTPTRSSHFGKEPSMSLTIRPPASREPTFRCIQPGESPTATEPSAWLKDILAGWDNPVFETAETRIPSIEGGAVAAKLGAGCAGHASGDGPGLAFATVTRQGQLSKKALSQAAVIAQVDRKFILVKTFERMGRSSLVMVDQHAADERCQLEALMRDYFEVDSDSGDIRAKSERLATPVKFEFSAKECSMLRLCSSHLEYWGIQLSVLPVTEGAEAGIVSALSLPPSILERARSEPKVLADLLRGEMWKLEDEGLPRPTRSRRNAMDWVANFQGCPQGILDMLNSRSCRSAIMFNDVLSPEQCRDLIDRLSICSFPFQCAHGRPSMAPLLDLDGWGEVVDDRGYSGRDEVSFGRKMRETEPSRDE